MLETGGCYARPKMRQVQGRLLLLPSMSIKGLANSQIVVPPPLLSYHSVALEKNGVSEHPPHLLIVYDSTHTHTSSVVVGRSGAA